MQMASTISSTTKPGMPASRASGSQGGVELLGVGGGELDGGGETEAARVTFGMVAPVGAKAHRFDDEPGWPGASLVVFYPSCYRMSSTVRGNFNNPLQSTPLSPSPLPTPPSSSSPCKNFQRRVAERVSPRWPIGGGLGPTDPKT